MDLVKKRTRNYVDTECAKTIMITQDDDRYEHCKHGERDDD
ncbi:hypothetical protein DFA_12292 [Cavenderia fasciculata]|uniref:Uncharacterized protein n=1 Tax=Cavenderia fasciculata TaxID=261658 RepID=F4QD45_CACFS|nr:uncharacterized protein DFA_12292 [Cavenderia fasciculata]EGG14516.1 hypothetical protein DFA_12292 [Cavenderia fasciculata]|eukprot:XP_004353935.1 hypothetical protein DFA_12292 [Cavenderia fasciculata]